MNADADALLEQVRGLLLDGGEVQRPVGVKRRVRGGDEAVESLEVSSWTRGRRERQVGEFPAGRISSTSTTDTRATPANTPKMTFSGTAVAQDAEAPVGEPAATDAHEVHDAVAGGAQFRPHDLAQDRHVVAVEEAPAEAEQDQERDGQRRASPALPTPNIAGMIRPCRWR